MKGTIKKTAGALCIAAALVPACAAAQTPDDWQFGFQIYGWFPAIDGRTTFPQSTAGSNVSVSAKTILENLEFVFMTSFEARKGRWGGFTDFIYMDLGHSRSQTRELSIGGNPLPAGATANVDFDLESILWTFAGSYRAVADPTSTLDVFAGARLADIKQELRFEVTGNVGSIPLPGRGGSLKISKKNWDGIVGVKGRILFGADRRWFAPYYLDVGTGDSDLTLQAMAGIGYSFGWGDIVGAWRYVDYDLKSGGALQDLSFSGPALSAVFRW